MHRRAELVSSRRSWPMRSLMVVCQGGPIVSSSQPRGESVRSQPETSCSSVSAAAHAADPIAQGSHIGLQGRLGQQAAQPPSQHSAPPCAR